MKKLFAHIASHYDRMNRIMSFALDRRWRRAALSRANLTPRCAVLDLACGTGDFALELLRLWPEAKITGVDLTPEMIDIARIKLKDQPQINFQVGDAQDLSAFPDQSFALIVCAFGFRNFPDKAKALAECRRLLTCDGELVILELFRPSSRILGALVNFWLASIALFFAHGTQKEYGYLRHSIAETMSVKEFIALAQKSGFTCVQDRFLPPAASALVLKRDHS